MTNATIARAALLSAALLGGNLVAEGRAQAAPLATYAQPGCNLSLAATKNGAYVLSCDMVLRFYSTADGSWSVASSLLRAYDIAWDMKNSKLYYRAVNDSHLYRWDAGVSVDVTGVNGPKIFQFGVADGEIWALEDVHPEWSGWPVWHYTNATGWQQPDPTVRAVSITASSHLRFTRFGWNKFGFVPVVDVLLTRGLMGFDGVYDVWSYYDGGYHQIPGRVTEIGGHKARGADKTQLFEYDGDTHSFAYVGEPANFTIAHHLSDPGANEVMFLTTSPTSQYSFDIAWY